MQSVDPSTIEHAPKQQDASTPEEPGLPLRCRPVYLAAEFSTIFILGPILLIFYQRSIGVFLIPGLLAVATVCTLVLLKDPSFDRRWLLGFDGFLPWLRQLPFIFLPAAAVLTVGCAVFRPELLFAFPRGHTLIWLMVMVLYPLLSAYPQEIIFRTFFFHRYHRLFPTDTSKIMVSGFCFGLAHVFFANWIAPVLATLEESYLPAPSPDPARLFWSRWSTASGGITSSPSVWGGIFIPVRLVCKPHHRSVWMNMSKV